MNYLDILLGSLLLLGLIRGFMKGLLVEVATLIAFIVGLYGAIHFSFYMSRFLKTVVDWKESTLTIVSFALVFLIIAWAIHLLGKALTKVAEAATLGLMNKFLGALFGFLKMGLILSAVLLFVNGTNNMMRFADEKTLEESRLYSPISHIGSFIFQQVIENGYLKIAEPDNEKKEKETEI